MSNPLALQHECEQKECSQGHLVFFDVVLARRVGLCLAVDSEVLMPAATMVACGTLVSKVAEAPTKTQTGVQQQQMHDATHTVGWVMLHASIKQASGVVRLCATDLPDGSIQVTKKLSDGLTSRSDAKACMSAGHGLTTRSCCTHGLHEQQVQERWLTMQRLEH